MDEVCSNPDDHQICKHVWQLYAELELREDTLRALHWHIVDLHGRDENWMFDEPDLDWLRDDPEFQELMDILHSDLEMQRESVREMEANGEMPPLPEWNWK
jgi:hypothetical protein